MLRIIILAIRMYTLGIVAVCVILMGGAANYKALAVEDIDMYNEWCS